jgi:limonene 1,2-monooxygenase
LAQAWLWSEEAADQAGVAKPSREKWRIVIPFHLADSKIDALAQIREGSARYNEDYFQGTLGRASSKEEEDISQIVDRGGAIVGTPDDAINAIEELVESTGGFGGFMGLAHEWASSEHTTRSYELWARYVAPHFQGQLDSVRASRDWVASNLEAINRGPKGGVVAKAFEDAGKVAPESIASRNTPGRA